MENAHPYSYFVGLCKILSKIFCSVLDIHLRIKEIASNSGNSFLEYHE